MRRSFRLPGFANLSNSRLALLIVLTCALCVCVATTGCNKKGKTILPISQDTANFDADEDAWVYEYESTTNYGSATELYAGYFNDDEEHIFLKFDTSSIPITATVVVAELWIYISDTLNYTGVDFTFSLETTSLVAAWTEGAITWDNAPATTTVTSFAGPIDNYTGWLKIRITNLVQDWVDGTLTNNGIAIKPSWGTPSDDEIVVCSRETAFGCSPKLVVFYNP